jgi:rhodanese-related sulfurtransferase
MGILSKLFGISNNASQLENAIREGALLVDVRTPGEFSSGSVKGAINIPYDNVLKNLKKFEGQTSVVVFCRSGARSAQAKALLDRNNILNVVNGGPWQNVAKAVNQINN